MDYLCTAHGVVHIRIGWNRLVPDRPFFIPKNPPGQLYIDNTVLIYINLYDLIDTFCAGNSENCNVLLHPIDIVIPISPSGIVFGK